MLLLSNNMLQGLSSVICVQIYIAWQHETVRQIIVNIWLEMEQLFFLFIGQSKTSGYQETSLRQCLPFPDIFYYFFLFFKYINMILNKCQISPPSCYFSLSPGNSFDTLLNGHTIGLIHKSPLWGVRDALPDGDGFRVTGVHGPLLLIVPPVSARGQTEKQRNLIQRFGLGLGKKAWKKKKYESNSSESYFMTQWRCVVYLSAETQASASMFLCSSALFGRWLCGYQPRKQ